MYGCVSIYICICVYVYVYVCIYVYMYICVYMCIVYVSAVIHI